MSRRENIPLIVSNDVPGVTRWNRHFVARGNTLMPEVKRSRAHATKPKTREMVAADAMLDQRQARAGRVIDNPEVYRRYLMLLQKTRWREFDRIFHGIH